MPAIWMDVDTALSEVPVNFMPLTDDTDFKSRETGIVYNQAGMDLVWNFVTTAGATSQTAVTPTTAGDYDWAHQGDGQYTIEIPASGGASINNNTEGFGWFSGFATGVLPWAGPVIGFRAAALNNAMVDGGDNLDVNTIEISGDSGAADNLEAALDGTGGVTFSAAISGNITGNLSGSVGSVTGAINTAAGTITTLDGLDTAQDAQHATTHAYVDALEVRLSADRAGYLDNLNISENVAGTSEITTVLNKLLAYVQLLARSDAAIETDNATELTAINADGGSGAGNFSSQTDSGEALRDWIGDGTNLTETGGDGDHLTALASAANLATTDGKVDTVIGYIDTEVAAILAAVDTEIAAIKAVTDQFVFTTANQVDATAITVSDKTGYSLTADIRLKKNTAFSNFQFLMVDATDFATPETGVSVSAERVIDGGSFAACANSAAEVANGLYRINLDASDLNGDCITFRFTGTGCADTFLTVFTQTE